MVERPIKEDFDYIDLPEPMKFHIYFDSALLNSLSLEEATQIRELILHKCTSFSDRLNSELLARSQKSRVIGFTYKKTKKYLLTAKPLHQLLKVAMEKLKINENEADLALLNENGEEAESKTNRYHIEKVVTVTVIAPIMLWSGRVPINKDIDDVLSKIKVSEDTVCYSKITDWKIITDRKGNALDKKLTLEKMELPVEINVLPNEKPFDVFANKDEV